MARVYLSKNSEYTIDGENLIRNGDENLGSRFVYASLDKIISVLEEREIDPKHIRILDKETGNKIIDALEKGGDMDPYQIGGKYFALIENRRGYSVFCSGKIKEIKDSDDELRLADEKDLNKK